MDKNEAIKALKNSLVAVIRIKDTALARLVTEELINNGFKFIELTLSIDNAPELIKELKEKYPNIYIGAGTVLTKADCEKVIEYNADFVVSPFTEDDVINVCNENNVLCLPGVGTATEINHCYKLGCNIVKAFPGDILGPAFIKNIKAPMPYIECMPSGGVNIENIGKWMASGAYAVSVGSAIYQGITKDNINELGNRAKEYLAEMAKHIK